MYEVDFDASNPFPSKEKMKRSGMRRKSTSAEVKLSNMTGMQWAKEMTKADTTNRQSVKHDAGSFKFG